MGDSRRIDFLAERDRRSGGENYVGDKENTVDYGGEHAQYEIPEYLKILYGAEAADVARADESNGAAYVEEVFATEENGAREYREEPLFDTGRGAGKEKPNGDYNGNNGKEYIITDNEMPETTKRQTRKDRKRADRAKRRLVQEEKLEKKLNEPIREASVSDSRRRRGIVFQVAFAAVIAVLVLAVAVSAIIKASHGTTYELAYMSTGELVKKGSAKAVFVRQGEILTAAGKGTFIPNVREGDRVNVGYVVGYITQDEYVADLKKLQSIDKVILSLQEKEALSDGFDIPELDNADRDIAEFKNQLTDMAVKGKLADCGDVILALNAALEYRNELIINAETGNSSVSQLQNQREALAAALEKNMTPVKAPQSGIVSFYIDGNEASENNAFLQLGGKDAGKACSTVLNMQGESHNTADKAVEAGETVARIITNQEYYILLEPDADYSEYIGRSITVASSDGAYKTSGKTVYVSEDGGNAIAVKTSQSLRSSLYKDNVNVSFTISRTGGYRVPLTALDDWDRAGRTARIALVRAGTVQFVYVTVVDTDAEYAIIKNNVYADSDIYYGDDPSDESEPVFKSGDCYIVNAKNVKEGQVIA